MRREVIIAGAVLVPFAVLVAAGFYFTPSDPKIESPLPRGGEGQGEGIPAVPQPQTILLRPDAGPPPAAPPPAPEFPPELAAPLKAVLPEVRRCFADQHLKATHEVRVRFTPTRDGGFTGIQVDEQNPFLAACLEDVFAEVAWHPEGPETFAPATHTFSFGPSPD
jgi:hypothetical protein